MVLYGYGIETRENKIQTKDKIELQQIHLSYLPSVVPFLMLSKTINLMAYIISPETFSVKYIFFDLFYLFPCFRPFPYPFLQ